MKYIIYVICFILIQSTHILAQDKIAEKIQFWNEINNCDYSQQLVPYRGENNLLTLINENGKEVTEYKFDYINYSYCMLYRVGINNLYGIVDNTGNEIIPISYARLEILTSQLILAQKSDGTTGLINNKNEIIIPFANREYEYRHHKWIIYKENELLGLFNEKGKLLISNKYEEIVLLNDNYWRVKKNGLYGIIDSNNKEILPIQNNIVYELYNLNSAGEYSEVSGSRCNLNDIYIKNAFTNETNHYLQTRIDNNNERNYLNEEITTENTVYKCKKINKKDQLLICSKQSNYLSKQYDEIFPFQFGYAVTKNNNLYGIINSEGKELIPNEYISLKHYENETYKAKKGSQYYSITISKDAVKIIYNKFDFIKLENSLNFQIYKNYKYGFADKRLKPLSPIIYDSIYFFSPHIYVVKNNDKYGLTNENGKVIIPIAYQGFKVSKFNDSVFFAKSNNHWKIINSLNKSIFESDFDDIEPIKFSDKNAVLILNKNQKFGIGDTKGNIILVPQFDKIHSFEKIKRLGISNKEDVLNKLNINVSKSHFAKVEIDNKFGLINETGKIFLEPIFDDFKINEMFRDNKSILSINGHFGVINEYFETIIPFEYDKIKQLKDGFFVRKNKKVGCINIQGKFILDTLYDEIKNDGLLLWGKINNIYTLQNDKILSITEPIVKVQYYKGITLLKLNNGLYHAINNSAKVITTKPYSNINFIQKDEKLAFVDEKYCGIMTKEGNEIFRVKGTEIVLVVDDSTKYKVQKANGKFYFVDLLGNKCKQ